MTDIEISNLLYRCAHYLEEGALDKAAALFSHARVQLSEGSDSLDADALLTAWQNDTFLAHPVRGRRFLVNNPIISIDTSTGKAQCESTYTILEPNGAQTIRIVASGRHLDKFALKEGRWHFSERRNRLDSATALEPSSDNLDPNPQSQESPSPTKAKILAAAQQVFSTVGYSEASIRKIADTIDLSPTLLFRHFGTKAGLFEAALKAAMGKPKPPPRKEQFGQQVARLLADPTQINCPHAMTVLATGNEEAREIAVRVLREYAIDPMIEWLGPVDAESRAREILALCAGFALYNARLSNTAQKTIDTHMVNWLAESIQRIVDEA